MSILANALEHGFLQTDYCLSLLKRSIILSILILILFSSSCVMERGKIHVNAPSVKTASDVDPLILTVNPFYPINGANWNDYVVSNKLFPMTRYFRGSNSVFPATDSPCLTLSSNLCWHGGEIKKVQVSSEVSCSQLTMEDSESAFNWRCQEDGLNPVYFYSTGFNKGKGLADFLTGAGDDFKILKVILKKNGVTLGESTLSKWWTNTIVNHNGTDTGGTRLDLSTASVIHTFSGGAMTTKGIDVSADKVSLVVMNGTTLNADSAPVAVDCRAYWPAGNQLCILNLKNKNFLWVEGSINTLNAPAGYYGIVVDRLDNSIFGASHNRLHHLNYSGKYILLSNVLKNHVSDGVFNNLIIGIFENDYVNYNYYHDLSFSNISMSAFETSSIAAYTKFYNIDVNQSTDAGIKNTGQHSTFDRVKIHNISNTAFSDTGLYSTLNNALITSSGNGIVANNSRPTYNALTILGSTNYGMDSNSFALNAQNTLLVNNNVGIRAGNSKSTLYDLFTIDNRTNEIQITNGASNINFFSSLLLGRGGSPCAHLGTATNVGVTNSTCAETGISDFTLVSSLDSNEIFQGPITDGFNLHGSFGISGILYSSITDWSNFLGPNRSWMRFSSPNTFPSSGMAGKCSTGDCMIFDAKISSSWSFYNFYGSFVDNAPCPDILKGTNAIVNADTGETYLKNATEFLLDGQGDDDGLCEANEVCYFNPRIGSMMDDPWSFTKSCLYDPDGTSLTGIKIYGP